MILGGLVLGKFSGVDPAETTADYVAIGRAFALYCVLLGHCYPAFRRFRGGRGTHLMLLGLLLINSTIGFFALILYGLIAWFDRRLPLATLAVAVLAPLGIWVEHGRLGLLVTLASSLVLIWRSRRNILAVFRREEKKFDLAPDLSDKFTTENF